MRLITRSLANGDWILLHQACPSRVEVVSVVASSTTGTENQSKQSAGFTLIELVAVLIVMAILGSVTTGRLADNSNFDSKLSENLLLSQARNAQLLAFTHQNVDLYLEDAGSEIRVTTRINGQTYQSSAFPKTDLTLRVDLSGSGGVAGVCGDLSSSITLGFDSKGQLVGPYSSGLYQAGYPICINGLTPSICISPSGFPHSGSCE